MIAVGAVTFGPTSAHTIIRRQIADVQARLANVQTGDAGVDLIFVVGGRIRDPDFEGIRVGRLFKNTRVLQVEVAIPRAAAEAFEQGQIAALATAALVAAKSRLASLGIRLKPDEAIAVLASEPPTIPVEVREDSDTVVAVELPHRTNGYSIEVVEGIEAALEDYFAEIGATAMVDGHEIGVGVASIYTRGADRPLLRSQLNHFLAARPWPDGVPTVSSD